MQNQGIGSWPARRSLKTPHRTALLHDGRATSYAELHDRVTRLAHLLRRYGIEHGDRVAFLGPNHPAFLEALFATARLGAVFVPLNTRLALPELRQQLEDSRSSLLLTVRRPAAVGSDPAGSTQTLAAEGEPYEALLASMPATGLDVAVVPEDLCMIMYTSGTTGRAKGAVLTHGNVLWNSLNVLVDVDLSSEEVTLVSAPMFHTAALNMTCLPTLLKGGTVILESSFDPDRTLELIARHRVSCLFGVPAMYDAIAKAPAWADTDLSSLRTLMCGGAPVPTRCIRNYLDRGLAFVQGYGMTETSPGVLLLDRADALTHAGSAGVPHFFTDVRLLDPEGEPVPPGVPGEVVVSGPNVTPGYWGLPQETADAFHNGHWFRSGDLATVDTDGYVRLVDRLKDMIISGGENIYPAEVEDALLEHPAVAECAVFGVPDEKWGEVGRAVVVLRPGVPASAEELLDHLEQRLARYKIPRVLLFTDALPRNGTGKLLKGPLRAAYSDTAE